jgi:hypothetical protein
MYKRPTKKGIVENVSSALIWTTECCSYDKMGCSPGYVGNYNKISLKCLYERRYHNTLNDMETD